MAPARRAKMRWVPHHRLHLVVTVSQEERGLRRTRTALLGTQVAVVTLLQSPSLFGCQTEESVDAVKEFLRDVLDDLPASQK